MFNANRKLIIIFTLALLLISFLSSKCILGGEEHITQCKEEIELGISASEVIDIMGEPDYTHEVVLDGKEDTIIFFYHVRIAGADPMIYIGKNHNNVIAKKCYEDSKLIKLERTNNGTERK